MLPQHTRISSSGTPLNTYRPSLLSKLVNALRPPTSIPRRRSNFFYPIDPYFIIYLTCLALATLGLVLVILPALPPDAWMNQYPGAPGAGIALGFGNGGAAAGSDNGAIGGVGSGPNPAPLPISSSPQLLLLAVEESIRPPSTNLAQTHSTAATATPGILGSRSPLPAIDANPLAASTAPHLPPGYFTAVTPIMRPLVLYVIVPSIALITALTLLVGHIDVEDPAAAAAPPENRLKLETVQGHLMVDDHFCRVCQVVVGSRTRHCRRCNVCVEVFDHHCQFLNCCIGRNNYRPFFLLVSLGTVNLYLGAWLAIHLTVLYSFHPSLGQLNPAFPQIGIDAAQFGVQNAAILLGVMGGFYLGAAALVTYLLGFHIRLYFSGGLTTFEWLVSDRDRQMAMERKKVLPAWAQYPSGEQLDYNPWTVDVPLENVSTSSHTDLVGSAAIGQTMSGAMSGEKNTLGLPTPAPGTEDWALTGPPGPGLPAASGMVYRTPTASPIPSRTASPTMQFVPSGKGGGVGYQLAGAIVRTLSRNSNRDRDV